MQNNKSRLLRILRDKSLSYGHFILSSGKESHYYVDSKLTTFDPEGVSLVGKLIFQIIQDKGVKVSAVGGLTMGADPMAVSTIIAALKSDCHLKGFSVRKEAKSHGKRRLIEGNLDVTDNVVILDDVITTGASTIKAIEAVREFGANIAMVVALVDRLEGGTEEIRKFGYDVDAIFTINDLLEPSRLKEANSHDESPEANSVSKQGVLRTESF